MEAKNAVLFRVLFVCIMLAGVCKGGNPPSRVTFGSLTGNVWFAEDAPIGTSLFEISATDNDSPEVFIESANNDTAELVQLGPKISTAANNWTVPVLLKKSLDRDRQPSTRILVFNVRDKENDPVQGAVKLYITDVNDNPPSFVNLPYRISLKETAAVNQTVFTVTASDPDDGIGGSVEYSMVVQSQVSTEQQNSAFVMADKDKGTIILRYPLDYETQIYHQYQVFAKDRGQSPCPGTGCNCTNILEPNIVCQGEPTTFTVTVIDVQDTPPFFERQPYIAYVPEDAPIGSMVLQVSALDGDRGIPNEISYSIVNAPVYPFAIDTRTGVITVASPGLDADQLDGQSYTITVVAAEISKPGEDQLGVTNMTTKLSITVLDVNDNAPQFGSGTYSARVQENTPRGVPLTLNSPIVVTDIDQTEKNQFTLSVEKDGQPFTVFDTLPKAGTIIHGGATVIVRVFNSSVLDYETTKNISFQLVARENSSSNAKENSSSNAQLRSTTVTVFIADTNDNSPEFPSSQIREVKVTENETPGTVLATFTATDPDSGDYGNVSYFLEDKLGGKFAIDPRTGKLTITAYLDREEPGGASYSLVVLATDNMAGEESSRRTSRLNVHVSVMDKNDNPPVFHSHAPTVTIQENAPINTVLLTLTATDMDAGENGRVAYRIVDITTTTVSPVNSSYPFALNRTTGVLSVISNLIGHYGTYVIIIEASDSSAVPLKTTTSFTVKVLDINLHAPIFTNPDERLIITTKNRIPEVSVREEQPPGSLVLQLRAVDSDIGDNSVVYYFLEPDLPQHWQSFRVDRTYGNLTNQYRLDREQTDYFQIYLKAEDNGTPNRLSKVIPLRVNLIDIDDNPPTFPPRTLVLSVGEGLENIRAGSVDIATDADSNAENRIRCYYVYGGEQLTSFSLQKLDGELFLQNPLSRNVTSSVNLVIKVTPDCSLPENYFYVSTSSNIYNSSDRSLLQVVVTVLDVNDNPPVLRKEALTVGMVYDVQIGTSVFELRDYTSDADTEINRQNKFRLLSTRLSGDMPPDLLSPAPFTVKANGSVVTQRQFRADLLGFFVLTVQAYDNDNYTDTGDLKIYMVSDIQRIKLVFAKQPDEVRAFQGELVRKLSQTLGYDVIADRVATHVSDDGQVDVKMSDMFIHARYRPTEEIVPTGKLESAFDYNEAVWSIFQEFAVRYALPALRLNLGEDNYLLRAFIIVVVLLVFFCLLLLILLISTVHRCRRKLLAATSPAYTSEKQVPDAYVPPGTNKYFAAANPLYERDDKNTRDPDRLSSDSIDDNAVLEDLSSNDETRNTRQNKDDDDDDEEEQEMYLELFDEETKEPAVHFSNLTMVLSEYDKGKNDQSVSAWTSSSPWVAGERNDGKTGHVTTDSGFNEQSSFERLRVHIPDYY